MKEQIAAAAPRSRLTFSVRSRSPVHRRRLPQAHSHSTLCDTSRTVTTVISFLSVWPQFNDRLATRRSLRAVSLCFRRRRWPIERKISPSRPARREEIWIAQTLDEVIHCSEQCGRCYASISTLSIVASIWLLFADHCCDRDRCLFCLLLRVLFVFSISGRLHRVHRNRKPTSLYNRNGERIATEKTFQNMQRQRKRATSARHTAADAARGRQRIPQLPQWQPKGQWTVQMIWK